MFWERDAKGHGYKKEEKISQKELIREGLKEIRNELFKWTEEVKETIRDDPLYVFPGDMHKWWDPKSQEDLKKWTTIADSDHNEGFSHCKLELSRNGNALFHGELSTQVPKYGNIKRAGYCNMKSIRPLKSFKRDDFHDWSQYNCLELRVRGDGRTYLLNLFTPGYFDVHWFDMFSYPLYTRGGPHWQTTRIHFSKFFRSSKGRVQDRQDPVALDRIASLGISAGDRVNAPFSLEIDYIGLYDDPDHTEEFAYEMYKTKSFMVAH